MAVCGGIAAYKAVEVCRRLVDAGAHVVPLMTDAATRFVGEVTLSSLASEPVRRDLFDPSDPLAHTRLAKAADVVAVCPATARIISSMATGRADDLVSATLLATRAPVVLFPAMHEEMWCHPATQENVARLRSWGIEIVGPAEGRLAGGDAGVGRLVEPEEVVFAIARTVRGRPWKSKTVIVTAGGTREPIDPVRVITNRSSGKQGHALAEAAAVLGAETILVTTSDAAVPPGLAEVVHVETAADMQQAVMSRAERADVIVMAAAVADFRPARPADRKLKKEERPTAIELEPTYDFLVDLGNNRREGQIVVGFAAETENLLANAKAKMVSKGLDLIVANDVSKPGVGFGHDTNEVTILCRDGADRRVSLRSKREVAVAVMEEIERLMGDGMGASDSSGGSGT